MSKAKLSLLYLELGQQLGYYSEFGDFVHGKRIAEPHQRQRLQPTLDEFAALCKQHGLTVLGIPASTEKMVAKWQACLDAEIAGQPRVFLPGEWIFAADPTDQGTCERWFAGERYYAAAAKLTVGGNAEQEAVLEEGLCGCTSTAEWAGRAGFPGPERLRVVLPEPGGAAGVGRQKAPVPVLPRRE